ncbi:MAG: UvrD-helicase domain-containing protein [Acidobacteria bacterium]|nr:UvrD-helicase domain-containing protein [Acidobacteriota bacterium]
MTSPKVISIRTGRPAAAVVSDAEARELIRSSLNESLVVEAAAGTGKTTELVRRIVALLEHGHAKVDNIAAVTFTNKAAGELKLRLRSEIDARLRAAPSAALEEALKHLEEASIGTIHAFCAQILRERPVEACVDPGFQELDPASQDRLFERAFRSWFQQRLNEPSPALRRALIRPIPGWSTNTPTERLRYAAKQLLEWRDYPADWLHLDWQRNREIDELTARMMEAAARVGTRFAPLKQFAQWVERHEEVEARDHDALEALLLKLLMDLNDLKRKGVEELQLALKQFRQRADADLAGTLRDEMLTLIDRYNELKRRTGRLDFLDLLIRARDLVRDHDEVRAHLQGRFTHLFIDEFQDTDPLQAELLLALASPGKLFIVGDPKQSIYKFRRADVVFYHDIRRKLEDEGARVVFLSRSFRAVSPIQELVNAAFEPVMHADERTGQAGYIALVPEHQPLHSQPSIVALPVPRPFGKSGYVTKAAINESLPDAVAAYVEWLVNKSGYQVRERLPGRTEEDWVPLKAKHICILFRRLVNFGRDLSRDYTQGLESRDIRHVLVGSKSFHHREEVETLRAALTSIEWPDDELSLFATLKGSLFAIPDATLLKYRLAGGRLHPFKTAPEGIEEFAPITEALKLLGTLHRQRNQRPAADTVSALLDSVRAHAAFAMRPAGHQVLANVYRVADLARQYESSGGTSFRGFVEELEAQSTKGEASEAPVIEEGADGVRLMTVHQAKGLECPVVILGDITANLAAKEPERYINSQQRLCALRLMQCAPWELIDHEPEELERERSEGIRVAYVAATRARDLLVVPSIKGEEVDGWLSPLHRAIGQARPGKAHFEWASLDELRLDVAPRMGLKDEVLLSDKEVAAIPAADSRLAYQQWREARGLMLATGVAATRTIFLPSVDAESAPELPSIEVITLDRPLLRAGGRRFGRLVHAALCDGRLALHARTLGASDEEVEAATAAVEAAQAHPLMQAASQAERTLREVPVTLPLPDGRVLDGVVDLAFFDGTTWTVVDFKTDDASESRYVRQLQWYVYAIAQLTGSPARGVLLAV